MDFPTYQSATNTEYDAFTDPHTPSLPATINSGDLLLLLTVVDDASVSLVSGPSGWTLLTSDTTAQGADDFQYYIWGKVATGSEGSTVTVDWSTAIEGAHRVIRITDWHGTLSNVSGNDWTGLYFTTSEGRPNPHAPDPPSATAPWGAADNLVIAGYFGGDDNVGLTSGPTGYSNAGAAQAEHSASNEFIVATATKTTTSATEDPGTFTPTQTDVDTVLAFTIMVRPVAGPTAAVISRQPASISAGQQTDTRATVSVDSVDTTSGTTHRLYGYTSDLGEDPADWIANASIVAASVGASETWSWASRSPNTTYYFVVISTDSDTNRTLSNLLTITTAYAQPTGMTVGTKTSDSVTVSATDASSGAAHIMAFWRKSSETVSQRKHAGTIPAGDTVQWTFTGLENATEYIFEFVAWDGVDGSSARLSAPTSVTANATEEVEVQATTAALTLTAYPASVTLGGFPASLAIANPLDLTDPAVRNTAGLEATDRATFVRVKVEDPDGNMQDIGDLSSEDFLDEITIQASADQPISRATFSFWRGTSATKSLAPLLEGSTLNRDAGSSYAPFLRPYIAVTVEIATLAPGETPLSTDWALVWNGLIDSVDWARERIICHARDRVAILNDTIIETTTTYGNDDGSENITAVMQEILDDNMGADTWPLTVVGSPTLPIAEYELGNVSVLEALVALADLIGWSLHYKWDQFSAGFRLTFYEPERDGATSLWTFGPDDYFDVAKAALDVAGIRNKGEVLYTDSAGAEQTVSDTRASSVALYGTRFIRLDSRGSSITTAAQANALLEAVLDDLEAPKAVQEIEAALFWPVEIGDVHTYSANGVHYDTDQTWACFGYTHTISPDRLRTTIQATGKPSGGFARWHRAANRTSPVDDTGPIDGSRIEPGTIGPKQLPKGSYDNLIRNPGFEQDGTDTAPWQARGGIQGTWSVTTTDPRSGSNALRHDPSGMTAEARFENGTTNERWEAAEGDQFYFRFYYQRLGNGIANDVEARIVFRNAAGTIVSSATATGSSNSTSYELLEVEGTAPATAAQVCFEIVVLNQGQTAERTFDDCYARRKFDAELVVGTLDANVVFAGTLQAATGEFTGSLSRGGIEFGPLHIDATERETSELTSEQTLETITVPAGVLGTGGGVRLKVVGVCNGNNDAKTVRIRFGGESVAFLTVPAAAGTRFWQFDTHVFALGSATTQRAITFNEANYSFSWGIDNLPSWTLNGLVDTGSDVDITVTIQLANSSDSGQVRLTTAELLAPRS